MNYWLVKAAPDTDYSIDDLKQDGSTEWTGVHNFQAINNIKLMKPGDEVFIYHSQKSKSIVGLGVITSEPYENTADTRKSWAVQISYKSTFAKPLPLTAIKPLPEFADFLLVRHTRLSVMPVSKAHAKVIFTMLGQ